MLYLVSTPIGNLEDITYRAVRVLQEVDVVLCEDTRTTGKLFSLLGIKAKSFKPYHEHNADKMRPIIIKQLLKGVSMALVSDAGTPLISDPGFKLVRDIQNQVPVVPIPGANALLPALQLSGLPSDCFLFGGFLPPKSKARQNQIKIYQNIPATLIFYESPNRLLETLKDFLMVFGNRKTAVVHEITKKFEMVKSDTLENLITLYENLEEPLKGELVIVVDRGNPQELSEEEIKKNLKKELKTKSVHDVVKSLVLKTNGNKKQIYHWALEVKDDKCR